MQNLNLKNTLTRFATIIVCLISNSIWADCDSSASRYSPDCDSTANLHYPSVVPPNHYGNAKTDSFNCALNGSKQLSLDQVNERSDLIPPSLNNRFYIMIGGNAAAEGVMSAKNVALANDTVTLDVGTLSETQFKVASNNFELAFGYTWKDFALDIEWLAVKSISFNASMINMTPGFSFSSTIKGDSLLGNLYWIFNDMYNAKLYGIFSLGMSHNQSFSEIGTGDTNTMNRYYPAGGIGLGARFNIISSLYADVAARALYLGKIRISAVNGTSVLDVNATRTWLGASFRLMWLI